MKKHILSNNRRLFIGLVSVTCLISVLLYLLIPRIERTICYDRLSNNLDVQPTSSAIRNALYKDLLSGLPMGLTYDQAIAVLEDKWRYKTIWRRSDLGGGFKEYILLDYCSFSVNDFTFLLVFSKDGTLTNLLNYIDD